MQNKKKTSAVGIARFIRSVLCFLLIFCMLPVTTISAYAAGKVQYQYIWLISKPTFWYNYTTDSGVWVVNPEGDNFKLTKQGEIWTTTREVRVTTQYTNQTTPTLSEWNGTPFKYTGRGEPFDESLCSDSNYNWAGNISGGASCEVKKDPTTFTNEVMPASRVSAPSTFSAGSTNYYICVKLKDKDIIGNKGKGKQMTANLSCFLFKSTKELPDSGSGGGGGDTPRSEVSADLSITGNNTSVNYKKFDVEGEASASVTFDPTDSSSNLDWDSYSFTGYNGTGWRLSESYSGTPKRKSFTITYSKSDIGFRGKPGSATDTVRGSVTVTDGESTDTASDSANIKLNFTNDSPVASIGTVSTNALADAGSAYDTTFFYAGEPITITDASYDPEKRSYPSNTDDPTQQYAIQYNGANILVADDFNEINKWDDLIPDAAADKASKTMTLTFAEPGYYTIKALIWDEIGASATATKTILVRESPAGPTAVINSGDYTFVDYPFPVTDGSTDPNDDIVSWAWDEVVPATEETTGTVTGTLRDATYPPSGSKPVNIGGSLKFSAPGEYTIGLSVTDATELSDHTEKTVKVIRDIPVAIVVPGPASKDNPSDADPHYAIDGDDGIEKVYVKQNRKIELDASSSLSPPASAIQWEQTEWIYANSDSDPDYNMDSVKIDTSTTTKKQVLLAKEVGEFKVTLILHNEYSDALAADDPDLNARRKEIIVKVLPDEDPLTTIQVDNANPNFHDNPKSVDVTIVGTAKSPDNDFVDYYNWNLYRDNNDDGAYSDNELQTQINKTKTSQVTVPVKFETGNTSKFLVKMDAYERFGQDTISSFISDADIRHATSQTEFEVNWRPCIMYTMRDFAYVDDMLAISPVLKDENIETCTVEWTLMKQNKAGEYEKVNASELKQNVFGETPVWDLGLHGGSIRITQDGYYRLDAVITDAEGHSEYFASTEIRIYDVPHAVISDQAIYRWGGVVFQFKESRKFTLDGNASYVNDSTGEAKHQLNRSLDEWSITPLDGQPMDGIYVGATADGTSRLTSTNSAVFDPGKNSFDEVLAILEPGRYRVDYRVTNTYGKKSPLTTQEIIIVADTAPIIEGIVQEKVDRGSSETGAKTIISIGDLNIKSDDDDIINQNWTLEVIYDKANDGFQNDSWQSVDAQYITVKYDTEDRVIMDVAMPETNLGKYQFRVYARDDFGQQTLPIVPASERKESTKVFDTEVDNVQPNGTFSTRSEAKGDVVFAIGDSAVSQAIQNATLTFANRFGAEAGMNVMDVSVEMVETSSINMTSAFQWEKDVNSSIGSLTLDSSGRSVSMYGNRSNPGKNAIWIPNADKGEQKFTFGYSIDFGDSFNGAGMFVNLARSGSVLNAYGISFNNSGPFSTGSNGSIWKMRYTIGSNNDATFSVMEKVADIPIARSGELEVVVDGEKLKISGGGMSSPVTVTMQEFGTGFGFFSSHYSHGCSDIGQFSLQNISMEVTKRKNLNDALSSVSWRDGAERFVIYVDDKIWPYMSPDMDEDPTTYPALLSSLLDANVHLIALGTDTNKSQLVDLLSQLNADGVFSRNNPSGDAMDAAEEFIKQTLRKESKDTMYVLVNERLNYDKLYRDYNGDPQWLWTAGGNTPYLAQGSDGYAALFAQFQDNPSIIAQKWQYFHNPNYYENSQGIATFNEEWMAHEVNIFSRVGKYEVDYRIKDNPVPDKSDNSTGNPFDEYRYWSEDYAANRTDSSGHITNPHAVVYVHRRPLAEFDFIAQKYNDIVDKVTITNNAYDLDHQYKDADKGLNLYEWKWKFASDATWRGDATFTSASEAENWINSQLVNLREQGMTNILVQYRVRDIDGPAESETVSVTRKTDVGWSVADETAVRNQGAWSLPAVRWITNKGLPPIARFDANNTVFGLGEEISVTDRSYSPNSDNIVKWQWTIERATGTKTSATYEIGSDGITDVTKMQDAFSAYLSNWIDNQPIGTKASDNAYTISLVVTDDKPERMTSDPFSVTIRITPENTAPDVDVPSNGNSMFINDNPTVYEYDSYDANQANPYYRFGTQAQKRGTETLDWSLSVDDPDNYDKYGTGNDSETFKIAFTTDRFLKENRTLVAEGAAGMQRTNYDAKIVSKAQAAVSANIAPFTTAQNGNLGWGAYRITVSVTDVPNNDSTPKTTEMVTRANEKPLHLYVIPKLSLSDVHFTFDGVVDNQVQIPTGETVIITCTTNDRSTGARVLYQDGDGKSLKQEMTKVKTDGETTYWSAQFVIPDNLEAEDLLNGEYFNYRVETYTTYGSRNGEETRNKVQDGATAIHILPIKLYDFTVTGTTDPSVAFGAAAMVKDLAWDRTNSENGSLMKTGYAFNFELYSKGMKDSDDFIRIRPTFYGYNSGTGRYDMTLDMYYLNDAGEYVLATTAPDSAAASGDDYVLRTREFFGKKIGSLRELELTSAFRSKEDRNTQKWTARYGVPGTAVFVRKGSSLTDNSMYMGDVLIHFDIEAMKHGSAKYSYIGKGQWQLERTGGTGALLNTAKSKYKDGDVLLMDGANDATLDYETRPVWTKLR